MSLRRLPVLFLANAIVLSSAVTATSAPFDVYYRPSDKGNWILYGGRESRAAADAGSRQIPEAAALGETPRRRKQNATSGGNGGRSREPLSGPGQAGEAEATRSRVAQPSGVSMRCCNRAASSGG